ncbi:siphovirus ReqiPepy6 Gp37-like family protein [Brevibacillus borstelensis]|uniref:siphovirus ReqiPepy6 Gp37-like family protein n=1 Tax=Brevibacillus borstelensis TaxID=45462 RepID=UPI0030C1AD45
MKPIRIMDSQFQLLGEVDTYSSLQWVRRWHKPGEFELHINPAMQNADKLLEDTIIFMASRPDEAAIIKHREVRVNETGTEELVVKGSMLAGLMGRRITYPPVGKAYDYIHAPVETIMKHYVRVNSIAPADPARVIPNLIHAPDLSRGPKVPYQTRYKQLDEELEKLSLSSGLGWHVWLDTERQRYVFDALAGRDLTVNQDVRPPAIFSTDYDNIESQSYVSSAVGFKNMAVVAGEGEGADQKIVMVGKQAGLKRYETFMDAQDIGSQEEGTEQLTEAQMEEMLRSRGNEKLAELGRVESFESTLLTTSNLVYRRDYDLGDIVTVVNRSWGVRLDARITKVAEVYEPDGFRLDATFGNSLPTLFEKMKQMIGR